MASAHERWQNALFDKLRGGFALAIWDEERRCLVVGRDAMGLIPCFYWWNERVLLASPSLDAILGQPEVDARFNRVLVAEYLQNIRGFQQVHETFYEDVRRLPPAHTLSVNGGVLSLTRYWDPLPPGFAWATEEEVSRFTDVFGTAVDRCRSVGADSLALSGGFDSVSIAVVAADRLGGRPPLHAVSLRFTDPSCDEGPRQTHVAQALGMPHVMRSLDECLDEDSFVGELRAVSRVSPCPVMSAWQPMYGRLLRSAADRGLGQLMMGTGGDEMFHVNMGYAADCLAALDLRGLGRFHRACQTAWPGAPARVARYVLWDGAIKGPLRQKARSLLGRVSPPVRDWILTRRLRQARPPWLVPADPDLTAKLERRPLELRSGRAGCRRGRVRARHAGPPAVADLLDGAGAVARVGGSGRIPAPVPLLRPRPGRAHPPHPARAAGRGRPGQGAPAPTGGGAAPLRGDAHREGALRSTVRSAVPSPRSPRVDHARWTTPCSTSWGSSIPGASAC